MPQTNNGKIDYKALPAPTGETTKDGDPSDIQMPSTEAQKFLAGIWSEALEMEDIQLPALMSLLYKPPLVTRRFSFRRIRLKCS